MLLRIHPDNPNSREIKKAVECLREGGIIIFPTDTIYALGCDVTNTKAVERICRLKGVKLEKASFSFICFDLSHISDLTKPFSRPVYRLMKNSLPGPFTFILNAGNKIPSLFRNKKKTIGIRVPDNNIARILVQELGHPIMSTSVHADDGITEYPTDPEEIHEQYAKLTDLVIDGGPGDNQPSTIVDCTGEEPIIIREGKGKISGNE